MAKGDGTTPDANVYDATTLGLYEKDEKAGSGGKATGGDDTSSTVVMSDPGKSAPKSGADSHPSGVQSFNESAT